MDAVCHLRTVVKMVLASLVMVCLSITAGGAQSLSGGLGATQLNGLDDLNRCNAQANGAREKLMVQALQRKLQYAKDLSAEQRSQIEQDIAWLSAKAQGSAVPAPNPRDPDRYLKVLTAEEQQEVNTAYNRFSVEVHHKCDEVYGSMTAYGDPAGRVRKSDPSVPFPTLAETPPASAPVARQPNCMSLIQGVRFQIMAEHMEQRLGEMSGLSAQERQAWEEDIAVVRAAAASDKPAMPQSPDPKNPMRYAMRLTPEDQIAINQEYAARSQTAMADCMGGGNPTAAGPTWTTPTSRTAQRRAEAANAPSQAAMAQAANAAAQAWLEAHPMAARKEVRPTRGLGTTEADYLERSGALACFERAKGFRAKLMADRLTTKRDSVAPQERPELDAWIAEWRAAEQTRADTATPPPGSNPNRDLQFLTNADQQEINMANGIVSNKVRDECNSVNPFGP